MARNLACTLRDFSWERQNKNSISLILTHVNGPQEVVQQIYCIGNCKVKSQAKLVPVVSNYKIFTYTEILIVLE